MRQRGRLRNSPPAGASGRRTQRTRSRSLKNRLYFDGPIDGGADLTLEVEVSSLKKRRTDTRKISEMRNLGPACEKDLNAAGIYTAEDLKRLGPEDAFVQMLLGRVKQGRSAKCCNAAYLYALYGAIHDVDWRELPDQQKQKFKALAAEMRELGRFK